jgi:hypothetical protein
VSASKVRYSLLIRNTCPRLVATTARRGLFENQPGATPVYNKVSSRARVPRDLNISRFVAPSRDLKNSGFLHGILQSLVALLFTFLGAFRGPLNTVPGLLVEAQPPKVGDLRPRVGDLRPRAGDLRPRAGDLRPRAGDLRPRAGDLRPRAGDLRPRVGDLRPRAGDLPPLAAGEPFLFFPGGTGTGAI